METKSSRLILLIISAALPSSVMADLQLTTFGGDDRDPCWSPDGNTIVYASYTAEDEADLWLIPASGGTPIPLAPAPGLDIQPAFSPDGKQIVFASNRGERLSPFDLWIVPTSGGDPMRLTDDPADDRDPAWRPDGKLLVFSSTRSADAEIWYVSPLGGTPQQLTFRPQAWDVQPAWTADGKQIYFSSRGLLGGLYSIWRMPAFGTLYELILGSGACDMVNVSCASDDRGFVFEGARFNGSCYPRDIHSWLWGGGEAVLTDPDSDDVNPAWSPGVQFLAYESDRAGNYDIWVGPGLSSVASATWGSIKAQYGR
jgi:Tol biopolymer transport system component